MELNINEIDRAPMSNYNHNYWETNIPSQIENKKAAKPFSYDDILSSLNMVVENGVLKKIHVNQPQQQKQMQHQQMQHQQMQEQEQQQPQRALTPQEQRQLMMQYRVKQVLEKKRVEQAKPSKMLFNKYSNAAPINPGNRMGRMFF
jgi:hypothetical protein